jgi:twitching motility protein PilT
MAVSILSEVLAEGVASKASDWHIKENSPINLRIQGAMVDTGVVPDSDLMDQIVKQLAPEKLLDIFYRTGDLDISYVEDNVGRFRVNIHRQRGMTAITMRHVKTKIMSFEELSIPPIVRQLAENSRGIVIVSGTTGSGKSTTLASMLQHINNTTRKHIITVEDPIEYEFYDNKSFFEQREVGLDTDSFSSALIHALRQDPDIIMVGEMRDVSSFGAALQAADTGHMVLTTLHSSNASQAINRILDFYPASEQAPIREALAVNLKAIISQRLLPRALGGGVVPAIEVMINTPIVRKILEKNVIEKLPMAVEAGGEFGMQSFNKSLLKLVNEGLITEEVALDAASNPESLKMNMKGIFLDSDKHILNI